MFGGGGSGNPTPGAVLPIIPDSRRTIWQPGVTYNGGIPVRNTIYTTLNPLGGTSDDTTQIQSAINSCPDGQVVKLGPGVFNINDTSALNIGRSNITLRGSGIGPGSAIPTTVLGGVGQTGSPLAGTYTALYKNNRPVGESGGSLAVLWVNQWQSFSGGTVHNLTADAQKGTYWCALDSVSGLAVGQLVVVDINTYSASSSNGVALSLSCHPDVYYGTSYAGFVPGGGGPFDFNFSARSGRSIMQVLRVASITGLMVTFETPFHITFPCSSPFFAQLVIQPSTPVTGVGVEDLYLWGGGQGQGNLNFYLCNGCWAKNVESHYANGPSLAFYWCYRSEIRDSYVHESANPNPGGGGYNLAINGSSDCLIENNISWMGNKVIVMRSSGGGNVVAYNYMDDAFGEGYPSIAEAGLNSSHYTTPHNEIFEGNYCFKGSSEHFWGSSANTTWLRNHLSSTRGAIPPLNTYIYSGNSTPYTDTTGRAAVTLQAYNHNYNFVGNVLGYQGIALLNPTWAPPFSSAETGFTYENNDGTVDETHVAVMWSIGATQQTSGPTWVTGEASTLLRQGNWDWATQTQRWHGIGGAVGSGSVQTIPNSYYLQGKPAFFGTNPWPWVDPATGTTHTLPAMDRFKTIRGISQAIPPGFQT